MRCKHADQIEYDLKGIFTGGLPLCDASCPYKSREIFTLDGIDYFYCLNHGEIPEEKSRLARSTQQPNQPSA